MNKQKPFLLIIATVLLLSAAGGTAWFIYWLSKAFFTYIRGIPKEVAASLVAGIATILVATLTIMLGRYFERKGELDALYRDKKTEMYDEFLKRLFQLFHDKPETISGAASANARSDEMVEFLRDFYRKQILWSGPEVIRSFGKWRDNLVRGVPDADSFFLMEEFLLSVRKDLRHNNAGLEKGFFAKVFLAQGDLFLKLAAENPKITLAEVAEIEKRLKDSQ